MYVQIIITVYSKNKKYVYVYVFVGVWIYDFYILCQGQYVGFGHIYKWIMLLTQDEKYDNWDEGSLLTPFPWIKKQCPLLPKMGIDLCSSHTTSTIPQLLLWEVHCSRFSCQLGIWDENCTLPP